MAKRKGKFLLLFLILALLVTSCSGSSHVEVGYEPPFIPMRVSINQHGEVQLSSQLRLSTPLGTFDLTAGHTMESIRREADYPVLIVRVDGQVTIYALEPGHTFDVFFDGDNRLYKEVGLRREEDGDIILELVSTSLPDSAHAEAATSTKAAVTARPDPPVYSTTCPGAFATRLSIGARARVVAVPRVVVRESPGTEALPVHGHSLSNGRTVTILAGPVCNGGMLWWKAESGMITLSNGEKHNIIGWVAEESGDEWLLQPLP